MQFGTRARRRGARDVFFFSGVFLFCCFSSDMIFLCHEQASKVGRAGHGKQAQR